MKKKEDIINYDFQGWPIYKMSVREILSSLGCTLKDGIWSISDNDPRLDIYPRRLIDDGMGYGVEEQFIDEVFYPDSNNCNIFTESFDSEIIKRHQDPKSVTSFRLYDTVKLKSSGETFMIINTRKTNDIEEFLLKSDNIDDTSWHQKDELEFLW